MVNDFLLLRFVEEAIGFFEEKLENSKRKGIKEVVVIVGKGIHSTGNKRIDPAINDFCRKHNINYQTNKPNEGCITIYISSSSSSSSSSTSSSPPPPLPNRISNTNNNNNNYNNNYNNSYNSSYNHGNGNGNNNGGSHHRPPPLPPRSNHNIAHSTPKPVYTPRSSSSNSSLCVIL